MSSFLVNPFISFPTATGVVSTFYEFAYTASRSTSITASFNNIATIGNASSGPNGLGLFFMANTDINSVTFDVRLNLVSGSTTIVGLNMEPQDTTDRFSMGGAYYDQLAVNEPFSASFSPETSSIQSGYAGYSLIGLQLGALDSGSISSGSTVYRSATYATKTSVPVPAGTYIIIGSAAVLPQDAGVVGRVRMFDGTTTYGEMTDIYEQDTSNWSPYWHVFRKQVASTTTFSLQARSDGNVDIEVRQASIIALNTSSFNNVYYAESTASFSTTSTAYINAMSQSFTIANPSNKHLILASAMVSGNSTVASFACKLRNNTQAVDYIPEHLREPNSTAEQYPTVVSTIVTFPTAINEIAWQVDCETGGTTAGIKDMTIAILDLGTT